MKKNIFNLFLLVFTVIFASSCKEEQGTEPGNDPNPMITVYNYPVSKPNNPDNDIAIRVAANSKVNEGYYLAEKVTEKAERLKSLGEEGYKDYVVSNGKKIEGLAGNSSADMLLKGLIGEYKITIVGVGSGSKVSSEIFFDGLDWQNIGSGTFTSGFLGKTWQQSLEQAKGKERYRLPNCYGDGYNILFIVNKDNTISFDKQETGYVHSKYGMVSFGPAASGSLKKDKKFTLVGKFTVSAGSFGEKKEVLELP